jgi:hypothetical protein
MPPQDWHPWIVYAHVLGAFAFAAGHGVAATMAFRFRFERDPSRIAAIPTLAVAAVSAQLDVDTAAARSARATADGLDAVASPVQSTLPGWRGSLTRHNARRGAEASLRWGGS